MNSTVSSTPHTQALVTLAVFLALKRYVCILRALYK